MYRPQPLGKGNNTLSFCCCGDACSGVCLMSLAKREVPAP
jgi:hypothetical protein